MNTKKYSMYKLRDDFKHGIPLPDDVNSFVKEALVKKGYGSAVPIIERKEKTGQFGHTIIRRIGDDMRTLTINFRYGMVAWIDMQHDIVSEEGLLVSDYTRIKNPLLETNPKKGLEE